jgi:hypothetical protein
MQNEKEKKKSKIFIQLLILVIPAVHRYLIYKPTIELLLKPYHVLLYEVNVIIS